MTIKVGDRLPAGTLQEYHDVESEGCSIGPNPVTIEQLTRGKKVVIFGLPGAFTPTCSAKHVPSYLANYDKLKANWPTANIWPLSHLSSEISLICTLAAEIGAASLLVLGLMTRPAAFIFGFAMVVAAFQVGAHEPWFMGPDAPAAKEPALLYLLPAVVLILSGAGSWSFDAALYREGKRKRW